MKMYMMTGCDDMTLKEVLSFREWSDEHVDLISSLEIHETVTLNGLVIVRYK